MPYCCVPYCRSSSKREKLSFHQIPADYERRYLWLKAISREGKSKDSPWIPNQFDVVCQKHFTSDDYKQAFKRLVLKRDAVPSVFYPTCLQLGTKKAQSIVKTELEDESREMYDGPESVENNGILHCDTPSECSSPTSKNVSIVKTEIEDMSFEISDGQESVENDDILHCDTTTTSSSFTSKNMSFKPSHRTVLIENDKNLHNYSKSASSSTILVLKMQNAALKKKLKGAVSKLSKARKRIRTLAKEKTSLLEKNNELSEKVTELSNIEKDAAEGSEHALFIIDQIRSRQKKFLRWNPKIIKICKSWQSSSPNGYKYIRNSKFLKLPCRTTIKKSVVHGTADTDFISGETSLKQLQ